MTEWLDAVEQRLLTGLEGVARGPRQDAVFAMWMVVRLCAGLLPPTPLSVAVRHRRLTSAERRLASLTLPGPVRRGLAAAVRELASGQPGAAAVALHQLIAPAREAIGADIAEVLADAARGARAAERAALVGGTR